MTDWLLAREGRLQDLSMPATSVDRPAHSRHRGASGRPGRSCRWRAVMQPLRAYSLVTLIIATSGVLGTSLTSASAASVPVLSVVARTGEGAADAAPGASYAHFGPLEFDGGPSIGADATIGFAALLSDGTAGFWLDHG